MAKSKKIKTAIEGDMQDFQSKDTSSDLVKAMNILRNNENIESNTILDNFQVNGLSLMNWAAQVYDFEFFKHYVSIFPKYRISGDDGRGRKELIQIAEAVQRDKLEQNQQIMDMLRHRR